MSFSQRASARPGASSRQRQSWLAGTALGCSLLVTAVAAPHDAQAANECGVASIVVCPIGAYPNGIHYSGITGLTLSLAPGATVTPTTQTDLISVQGSTGDVNITTGAGSLLTFTGTDINGVYGSTTSGSVNLQIDNVKLESLTTGTSGNSFGVQAFTNGGGDLTIKTRDVSVSSYGGSAIAAIAFGGGTIDITADTTSSNIAASQGVILGINRGAGGSVSITSRVLQAMGGMAEGISADANGDATIVSGTITMGAGFGDAIVAKSAIGDTSITSGVITASARQMNGINATATTGSVAIGSDVIAATASGVIASGGGDVTIKTNTISAGVSSGEGLTAVSQSGDVAITSGTVTVGAAGGRGIFAQTTAGSITIDAGTTRATNTDLYNYSTISDAIAARSTAGGVISITSLDASALGVSASAIRAESVGGSVTIDSGKARANTGSTAGVAVLGLGDTVTIKSQDAEITGVGSVAIQAYARNGDLTVTSGRAVATGAGGAGIQIGSQHDATLTITGETSGAYAGASVSALNRANVTVAAGASVTSSNGVGIVFKADPINGGTATAGFGASLTTAGYIAGGGGANAVQFSGGADTLTVLAGASFGGAIDGGAGLDTLVLDGAGQTSSQTIGVVTGFETAQVKAGQFTLTSDTHFDTTTISGGKLITTAALTSDVAVASGATLQVGAGGATGSLNGDLALAGVAIFSRATDDAYAGDITGSGDLVKQGAGRLVLSGAYGLTGTTTVQGGTLRILQLASTAKLQIDSGLLDLSGLTQTVSSLSGGATGSISIDGGALTVNQSGTTTFAGVISGSGAFTFTGGGVLDLTGTNTYTGATTISGGKLKINGSVTSNVTVGASGVLGGSGTIKGNVVVQSGGQVAPGNSPGTLTVAGNFTFAAGSVYQAEVLPTGEHDLIAVSGVTTIQNGATVRVLAGGSAAQYTILSQYGILTSTGGVVGQFSGVTTDMAFLTPTLSYSANAVRLNLLRNDVKFASLATTPNQAGVARSAEALGVGAAIYDALATQSTSGAVQGYDALDGQIHADVSTLLLSGADRMRAAVQNRAAAPTEAVGGWGDVLAGWNQIEAGAGAAGVKTTSSGLVIGGDTLVGATRLGLAVAYDEGRATVTARGSQADSTSGEVAAYAASTFGPVRAHLGAGYAWSSIDTLRAVSFPGTQDRLNGKYDARTAQVFGQVALPLTLGHAAVEPFVSGGYLSVKSDDANETGGAARLNVYGVKREVGVIDFGVKLKTDLGVSPGAVLHPHAAIAWRMTTGDLAGATSNAFTGGAVRFVTTGAKYDANALAVQVGADLISSGRARFGVTYDGAYGARYEAHSMRAGGAWRF
jgi:outer membrane autotransporter protein